MLQLLIMAISNKSLSVIILKRFQAVKQSPEQVRVGQEGLAACSFGVLEKAALKQLVPINQSATGLWSTCSRC